MLQRVVIINGIIIIDKPRDFTSFDVIAVVRKTLHQRKTGHTGTLDPMATGVLPVLLGCATKAQDLLPDTDKEYLADFTLGITTDTLDITGTVLSKQPSAVTTKQLLDVLPQFRGNIMQKPPMYSAVSKDGVRLYELARQGIVTEREARPVTVSVLELIRFDENTQSGTLKVSCSKGTYIRVICDDIGAQLGCGGVMTALRRTRACGYQLQDAITLDRLRELAQSDGIGQYIRPVDSVFSAYPRISITSAQEVRYCNGAGLMLSRLYGIAAPEDGALYRVYCGERFLGLGTIDLKREELSVKKRFDTDA